jgi:surfactin synthase thioesterase subunit
MNTDQASHGYLLRRPIPGTRLRLFCFHHAGAGATAFKAWPQALSPADVLPVQLPGREGRVSETRFGDMELLVEELRKYIGPELRPPYAFYGHSMGALISFNIARAMEESGQPGPEFVAVGAAAQPDKKKFLAELLPLSDPDLAQVLDRRHVRVPARLPRVA